METLIELVKNGGPFAMALVLAYMWHLERTERQEIQKTLNAVIPDTVKAITKVNSTLRQLTSIVSGRDGLREDE